MRVLLNISIPNEPFNTLAREGRAGQILSRILEETAPEAVYFTAQNGSRGGVIVANIERASDIPSLAEPWFLSFSAKVEFHPAMTPDDLGEAGLDALGKKWG